MALKDKQNSVYIATSLDGYIADKEGGISWLDTVPNPEQSDMGFFAFMDRMDALLMGKNTFETVLGFGVEWPYAKPVFVLSNSLNKVPENLKEKVFIVSGSLDQVLSEIHALGFFRLYIDGGRVIQSFLKEDKIDELILTTIPVLLGDGIPLFAELPGLLEFSLESTEVHLGHLVMHHYTRKR